MCIKQGKINLNLIFSDHARYRMEERKIALCIIQTILRAIATQLQGLKGQEVIIIDRGNNISIIIAIAGCNNKFQIKIITLLDKSKVFVKSGTRVINL